MSTQSVMIHILRYCPTGLKNPNLSTTAFISGHIIQVIVCDFKLINEVQRLDIEDEHSVTSHLLLFSPETIKFYCIVLLEP